MLRIFIILFCTLSAACSSVKESPAIYFSNASSEVIQDVETQWTSKNLLTLAAINPGDSRAKSFYIKKPAEFFGPISVSWIDSSGKKIVKEFNFGKERMPNFSDKRSYNFVQLYFLNDNLEVVSSDDNNADEKTKVMDLIMLKHREEAERKGVFSACVPHRINLYTCPGDAVRTSLVRVQTVQ